MVSIASVLSFGFKNVFWSLLCLDAWLDEMDGFIVIPQWTRWIESSVLVCGYFGMHEGEAFIGLNSVSLFVWVRKCILVCFALGRMAG